jgi:predicted nucleotidyltransferase
MRLEEGQLQRLRGLLGSHSELSFALLFGSMATGEAGPASDIDIAVAGREVATDALAAEVSLALGRETDVVRVEGATIPLLEQLLRDGVVIVENVAGSAAAWRSRTLAMLETDRPWYRRMSRAFLERVAEKGL